MQGGRGGGGGGGAWGRLGTLFGLTREGQRTVPGRSGALGRSEESGDTIAARPTTRRAAEPTLQGHELAVDGVIAARSKRGSFSFSGNLAHRLGRVCVLERGRERESLLRRREGSGKGEKTTRTKD